jgi:GNAT superfamily N-acetyltransferase
VSAFLAVAVIALTSHDERTVCGAYFVMARERRARLLTAIFPWLRQNCCVPSMLRQARREDIPAMQRIRGSVQENRLIAEISDSEYLHFIEVHGRGWVVEAEDVVVAFGVCRLDGTIWALFVHPAHEKRGYGRQLHDAMIVWLWSHGVEQAHLTTEPGTRAERFYRAAGWTFSGTTRGGESRYVLARAAP